MPKAGCTNDIDGITPTSNTDASPRAWSGWYCPLPASLLTRRDASLTALLKASRFKILLRDLALMFFADERPKDGELPEDNSSSAGASASSWRIGYFPLLWGTRYKAQPLSCTSLPPRSLLFSTWASNWSFSRYRSFIFLACSSCFLFMS